MCKLWGGLAEEGGTVKQASKTRSPLTTPKHPQTQQKTNTKKEQTQAIKQGGWGGEKETGRTTLELRWQLSSWLLRMGWMGERIHFH